MKLKLIRTCGACPEQYDVYLQDDKVGYMRLRHGYFTVECRGVTVYVAQPKGDGIFEWEERSNYLNAGCQAILAKLAEQDEDLYEIGESP